MFLWKKYVFFRVYLSWSLLRLQYTIGEGFIQFKKHFWNTLFGTVLNSLSDICFFVAILQFLKFLERVKLCLVNTVVEVSLQKFCEYAIFSKEFSYKQWRVSWRIIMYDFLWIIVLWILPFYKNSFTKLDWVDWLFVHSSPSGTTLGRSYFIYSNPFMNNGNFRQKLISFGNNFAMNRLISLTSLNRFASTVQDTCVFVSLWLSSSVNQRLTIIFFSTSTNVSSVVDVSVFQLYYFKLIHNRLKSFCANFKPSITHSSSPKADCNILTFLH